MIISRVFKDGTETSVDIKNELTDYNLDIYYKYLTNNKSDTLIWIFWNKYIYKDKMTFDLFKSILRK